MVPASLHQVVKDPSSREKRKSGWPWKSPGSELQMKLSANEVDMKRFLEDSEVARIKEAIEECIDSACLLIDDTDCQEFMLKAAARAISESHDNGCGTSLNLALL